MRVVYISIFFVFLYWSPVYAIPVPALFLWYDFLLFVIPSLLTFFGFIYFYYKNHISSLNIYLFSICLILFLLHIYITWEIIWYIYIFLSVSIIWEILIRKYKYHFFQNIIFITNSILVILLIKILLNIYTFYWIINCLEYQSTSTPGTVISNIRLKDNFFVVSAEGNSQRKAYAVIQRGWLEKKDVYLKEWKYTFYYWWDIQIWKDIIYRIRACIPR